MEATEQQMEDTVKTPNTATNQETQEPVPMRVKKRDGRMEPVDVNKIVRRVTLNSEDLRFVDPYRVAIKAISGLYDGATTKELDNLSIQTAAMLIGEEPQYSKLAARLLSLFVDEEVRNLGINSFSESIEHGFKNGLIAEKTRAFVQEHKFHLEAAINTQKNQVFEYFGLRTVYDRYLLKDPKKRDVCENPQYFFMRVACGLSHNAEEAIEFYKLISTLDYLPSTPTLFNSGTLHPQMSSCYLLDSPEDDLKSIYQKYQDIAMLSKFAGGIGVAYHRVRARGSLIKGTNGHSNGVVPWLKTLDSSVAAVNQGGKRKGACCVYLETWHSDLEEFLELRANTGDESKRTHNLNLANWVPDLFMKRVKEDGIWSLFDPKEVPEFPDLYGEAFEKAYVQAEKEGRYMRQTKARDLYARMMTTLAETGNGWMTFKDASNLKSNQTAKKENVIHLSNLCTEILEITNNKETAVCNLGSINLGQHVTEDGVDYNKIRKTVKTAVKFLDRVVDINFYPINQAADSNSKWRPIGMGAMGLQDVFFKLGLPFDSNEAQEISRRIQEEIYFAAIDTSCELAEKYGPHANFADTRAADGKLQFDLWNAKPHNPERWTVLKERIKKHGLRNSLVIAIAPTATIASIAGCYEAIEPQVSNLFKRETLSGEFLQINKHLVRDLKKVGLWTEDIRNKIKAAEGSIQDIAEIPETLKLIYRTVWELPMKELINMAAERGAFIDQSQSLNLFLESPTIGKLSSMYMYAWEKGVKTTYYLRSRPATRINKTTIKTSGTSTSTNTAAPAQSASAAPKVEAAPAKDYTTEEIIACSIDNPEACEACQ